MLSDHLHRGRGDFRRAQSSRSHDAYHPARAVHGSRSMRGTGRAAREQILRAARKLADIGADFLICPDNTAHQSIDLIIDKSPLPWLHIAGEVASTAQARGYHRVGVLGTKYLMEGPVYPPKFSAAGIAHEIPSAEDRERINAIIFEELVYGALRGVRAPIFSGRDCEAEGSRMRRGRVVMHRNPASHQREGFFPCDPRLHAPCCPRRPARSALDAIQISHRARIHDVTGVERRFRLVP